MTSADETPTCRAEYPHGPNPMPNTRIVRCGKPAGHPEWLHAEALEDGELGPEWAADETPARPDAEPRNAIGETPEEFWRRRFREVCDRLDEAHTRATEAERAGNERLATLSRERGEARAEVERLTRSEADLRESIGARAIDDAQRERDEIAEDLADRNAQIAKMGRKIRRLEDEARAKVDGGEWQWGVRWMGGAPQWHEIEADARWDIRRDLAKHPGGRGQLVRRRLGPVEAVGDDGSGP